MSLLLVVAILIAIWGFVELVRGEIIFGILLLVIACLVGPGGYSIFH
jgi:hypothetical protein